MKMKPGFRNEVITVSVLLVGGGLYFGFRPTAEQMLKQRQEAELIRKIEAPRQRAPAATEAKPETALIPVRQEVNQLAAIRDVDLIETLKEYRLLTKKVLMSELERARLQEILEDPGFLQGLKSQLLGRGEIATNAENNQAAVKLLLEALRYSESSIAEAILQDIIRDPGVENTELPIAQREIMAETKAEIMYVWSSRDYAAGSKIAHLLPGTVTENIWKNVKSQQAQNEAESSVMAQRFAVSGSHHRADDVAE